MNNEISALDEKVKELTGLINNLDVIVKNNANTPASERDAVNNESIRKAGEDAMKALSDAQDIKVRIDSIEKNQRTILEKADRHSHSPVDPDEAKKVMGEYLRASLLKAAMDPNRHERNIPMPFSENFSESCKELAKGDFIKSKNKLSIFEQGGLYLQDSIWGNLENYAFNSGIINSISTNITLPQNVTSLKVPYSDFGLRADGSRISLILEGDDIPSSNFLDVKKIEIRTITMGTRSTITAELLGFQSFDALANIQQNIDAELSYKIEDRAINGESADYRQGIQGLLRIPTYTGAYSSANSEKVKLINSGANGEVVIESLISALWDLKSQYRANASILMNRSAAATLYTSNTDKFFHLIELEKTRSLGDMVMFAGKKLYVSDYMPAPTTGSKSVILGDFSKYVFINSPAVNALVVNPYVNGVSGDVSYGFTWNYGARLTNHDAIVVYQLAA